jgi:hypothetical protein
MSWRSDLRDRLRASSDLAAVTNSGQIAWFEDARSWTDDSDSLVLTEISPGREYTHSGPDGLDRARVQFDLRSKSGDTIETMEAALRAELEQDGVTVGSTRFGMAFQLPSRGMGTEDLGNQRRVQRLILDFEFFHETV